MVTRGVRCMPISLIPARMCMHVFLSVTAALRFGEGASSILFDKSFPEDEAAAL